MLATHVDAEKRYEQLRREAVKAANEILLAQSINDIKLRTIDVEALNASRVWETSKIRRTEWDWFAGYAAFKFRYPKRFEVAVWEARKLIALSLGRPTYQGTALRLDFVEALPKDLSERPAVIEYVLLGYDIYARLINAKHIRIMNPVNSAVLSYYEKFGYEYCVEDDYLYKGVY